MPSGQWSDLELSNTLTQGGIHLLILNNMDWPESMLNQQMLGIQGGSLEHRIYIQLSITNSFNQERLNTVVFGEVFGEDLGDS